jgi:hypothetical protein
MRNAAFARLARVAALLALSAPASACAYRVPEPEVADALPSVSSQDLAAAEITVQDEEHLLGPDEVASLQVAAGRMLAAALVPSQARADGGERARIQLSVRVVGAESYAARALSQDGIAIFALWPALFGMVIDNATIATDIRIEKGGVVYRGQDETALDGSLFAPAEKRALGRGLDRALRGATPELATR